MLLKSILAVAVVYIAAFVVIAFSEGRRQQDLVLDEPGYLQHGIPLARAFWHGLVARDFSDPIWKKMLDNYGTPSPKVGVLFFGVASIALNIDPDLHDTSAVPALRLLIAAISAACVALIFMLGRCSASNVTGGVAAVLLLANPIFRSIQTAVLADALLALFVLLALWSLQHLDANLRQQRGAWRWFVAFGAFAGLAVSTKLYGFAVYLVFVFVVARHAWLKSRGRALLAATALLVFALGAAIFVGTNPTLYDYHDFWPALRTITAGHLHSQRGVPNVLQVDAFPHLLTYPFIVFRGAAFDLHNLYASASAADFPAIVAGYVICLLGIVSAARKKSYLPVVWFVAAFLVVGYVVMTLGTNWIVAKVFLFPALAVVWASSQALDLVDTQVRRLILSRRGPVTSRKKQETLP